MDRQPPTRPQHAQQQSKARQLNESQGQDAQQGLRERRKQFVGHVFRDMAGAMSVGMAYLGVKTGLFEALGSEPQTAEALARKSNLQLRYVQEWLAGMVSAEYVHYNPTQQTYHLPPEHAHYLCDPQRSSYLGGFFYFLPPAMRVAKRVATAFQQGGGVPLADFDPEFGIALDLMNRGLYREQLIARWIPQAPEMETLLQKPCRILDLGCGMGHALLSLAQHYTHAQCTGVDLHQPFIEEARHLAQDQSLNERVHFHHGALETLAPTQSFDIITAFDIIHDLHTPHETLHEVKRRLNPGGMLFIMEPKASPKLEENRHPMGTIFYGMSLFHCMTQSLAAGGPGLGTCLGPEKTQELLHQTGFNNVRMLDIPSVTNHFYLAA